MEIAHRRPKARSPTPMTTHSGHPWRHSPTLLAVVIAVAGSLVTLSPPAGANNYVGGTGKTTNCDVGGSLHLNNTDPNPLTWAYPDPDIHPGTLKQTGFLAVDAHMKKAVDLYSHNTSYMGNTTASVTSNTDVVNYDQDYVDFCFRSWDPVGPLLGMAICVSLVGDGRCEKHEVRYDNSFVFTQQPGDGMVDQVPKGVLALVCHEVGHAIGLAHRGTGTTCMIDPLNKDRWDYDQHDIAHMNGGYFLLPDNVDATRYVFNGQKMVSPDGSVSAVMQSDGNFVVYAPGKCTGPGASCWASNTAWAGNRTYAVMQGDGNFVLMRTTSTGTLQVVCATGTWGHPGAKIELVNTGALTISGAGAWWSTPGGRCV